MFVFLVTLCVPQSPTSTAACTHPQPTRCPPIHHTMCLFASLGSTICRWLLFHHDMTLRFGHCLPCERGVKTVTPVCDEDTQPCVYLGALARSHQICQVAYKTGAQFAETCDSGCKQLCPSTSALMIPTHTSCTFVNMDHRPRQTDHTAISVSQTTLDQHTYVATRTSSSRSGRSASYISSHPP